MMCFRLSGGFSVLFSYFYVPQECLATVVSGIFVLNENPL